MSSSETMKALRYIPANKRMELHEIPIPEVDEVTNVLVRVSAAGLCGTDLHIVKGEFSSLSPVPLTLGHEFCGVVAKVHPSCTKFKPGDRVGVDPNSYCHACHFCFRGLVNFCTSGGMRSGVGIRRNGGMAEYCKVPDYQLHPLPEGVSDDMGVIVEPLACILRGWQRVEKFAPIQPDTKIVILGAGIIGNLWACALYNAGFRKVVMTEIHDKRREIAKKMKTGFQVMSPDKFKASMPENIEEDGLDLIVECTGNPDAVSEAIRYLRRGGACLVFGCSPRGQEMKIYPEEIFAKELLIFGSQIDPLTYPPCIDWASNIGPELLDIEHLGIESFKLEQFQEGLAKLDKGEISKVMFHINPTNL